MPVRVYDIAKKYGLEHKVILEKAKALGISAAKVPSSSLDKISAGWLEEELLKDYPDLAVKLSPYPAVKLPASVRVSEVARTVGLPIDQVQEIIKEFELPFGPGPDQLDQKVAEELKQLIKSGEVVERRLDEIEEGGTSLNLCGFRITEDWARRIGSFRHIQALNVAKTGLSTVPDAFSDLNQLSILDLSGNDLEQLPKWLANLLKLKALYLHGNATLNLPAEILGPTSKEAEPAKPRDILEYYFRLQSGGKRPLNEAKLIILGRGEVGKTCLVNRLVHDQFTNTAMTLGISITQWKILVDEETIRLHTWDFGGQEIQHATHQFFLTERSLYLVVLNGRAGAEDDDAEYWSKFIKTFGGCSPTVVVLNKFQVQPFEVDETGLKEKYPFIRDFVETDCEMNLGIEKLRAAIRAALASMNHVRVAFPAEWFQIKERLSEMQEPFISFRQFRALCESKNEKDHEAQETLAVFLNALGIALNFRADPRLRDETVLNPHWLTKGVYRIITAPALSQSKGELWLGHLGQILPQDGYPPHMHTFLIELMRKFELCFPYEDDELSHRYLIPELLGKKQPQISETFSPALCLNFRYDYRILPEGLLPRFITRTHVMSNPIERWRTGVVLRWEGVSALVRVDKQERQIVIRVLGDSGTRRRLLAVIRENFDHIHSEMNEFRPTELIALEDNPDQWVNQHEIETFHKKKVEVFAKAVGSEILSVNVADVLRASDVPGAKSFTTGNERPPVRAFLSYAHADERWRAKLEPNLVLLQRAGLLKVWCDLEIKPGHVWDAEIKQKLIDADLYILLVSTALLASEYVHSVELPIAQRRVEADEARLVPVIIKDCSWKNYLGDYQALPTGGRPIKKWSDRDTAFHDVEEGLRKVILEVQDSISRKERPFSAS
jgi:internalin A